MAETATEPIVTQTDTSAGSPPPAVTTPADPFALDEAQLASLSPEQRASLDPILEGWKSKAKERIEVTRREASEESVKPYREKAQALEQLVRHPEFVKWWNQQQAMAKQGQGAEARAAVDASKPQDFATPDEWSQAVINASNGDPALLQQIQQRMFSALATPYVQQSQSQMRELNVKLEMKELMEQHPDYKELDQIGLNEKGEGTSLLEHFVDLAEKQGRPLEEGYQAARRYADAMGAKAQASAMGLVKDKRDSAIAGPSTSSSGGNVIYVKDTDELIRKSMEAELSGNKNARFEIKN